MDPGVCRDRQGDAEAYDRFGESLTAADFSGNGRDDLAVGAPWDSIAGVAEVGTVNVLYGTASGLGPANDQLWHQNQPSIEGGNEAFDRFGESLSSGDFSGNGRADLGVGVPGESIGGITDIGALNVLYGTAAGLGSANNQLWHQNSAGIVGDGEPYDRMSGRLRSSGTYRIGFEDGTDVRVNGDRLSHSPPDRIDMSGVQRRARLHDRRLPSRHDQGPRGQQCRTHGQQQLRVDPAQRR